MSNLAAATATSLQAEVRDLAGYLDGLPAALRSGGAFSSYEARLEELKRALASETLKELQLPSEARSGLLGMLYASPSAADEEHHRQFQEQALAIERQRLRDAHRSALFGRGLNLGVLLAAGAAVASLPLALPGFALATMGAAALGAATQLALDLPARSRRNQVIADRIHLLRSELELVANLSPDERAEPKRIEEISRRILALLSDFPTEDLSARQPAG